MSNVKIVTTRKEYECFGCGEIIPKGSKAEFAKWRGAVLDDHANQIGISYGKYYAHDYRCDLEPERRAKCANSEHEWEAEHEFDGYVGCHPVYIPTGNDICKHCGVTRLMVNEDY